MMNEHEFLLQFQKILEDEEYDSSLVDATEFVPYERLLVFLGLDEKDRERILEVTALKQQFIKGFEDSTASEPNIFRVQFLVNMPFEINPETTSQVSSLICYLNRMIEIPGFEMNEADLKLFYRYVLMYGEKKVNKKLCISIVGLIMLLLELFGSTLEKTSKGETTFNQLLEQIIQIAHDLKQD